MIKPAKPDEIARTIGEEWSPERKAYEKHHYRIVEPQEDRIPPLYVGLWWSMLFVAPIWAAILWAAWWFAWRGF